MPLNLAELDMDRVNQFGRYLDQMSQPSRESDLKALYEKNKTLLLTITPQEIFAAFTNRLDHGSQAEDVLKYLDKIINVLHKGLSDFFWPRPEPGSFLFILMAENNALLALLDRIRSVLQQEQWPANRQSLLQLLNKLPDFDRHYLKKENILFPSMEKADPRFNGLSIMWALHDRARGRIRQARELVRDGQAGETAFYEMAGQLLFTLHGLVIKENLILFPAATELFNDADQLRMLEQSFDYGFALIEPPPRPVLEKAPELENFQLATSTGSLKANEALLIFNSLPVDLTFVDEQNKVRYFNKAKDRFFPRSPAVIGRDVSRCHPPESVGTVLEIIESFRAGRQNEASFWIRLKGRLILIRYFALRSENGLYRGVLEVSQDITDLRGLEGERRLLQWDDS